MNNSNITTHITTHITANTKDNKTFVISKKLINKTGLLKEYDNSNIEFPFNHDILIKFFNFFENYIKNNNTIIKTCDNVCYDNDFREFMNMANYFECKELSDSMVEVFANDMRGKNPTEINRIFNFK